MTQIHSGFRCYEWMINKYNTSLYTYYRDLIRHMHRVVGGGTAYALGDCGPKEVSVTGRG